tara:strand:- start:63488 stop:63676 length:189 start_codon:yes stop_codon:yes gene_type:complete
LRVEIDNIQSQNSIYDDLGIDSLTRVTIFYEIQDHFNIDKDESDAAQWRTIQDILTYMEKSN